MTRFAVTAPGSSGAADVYTYSDYGAADSDNGLTSVSSTAGSANLTYDGNHNLSYDGYNTLTYDVENRMVEAQNAAWGASQYLYDPLGQRKQKTVGVGSPMPVTTQFVLAGGEEIGDYYASSQTWRLTVRGVGGLPLAAVVPAADGMSEQIAYIHHDVQGSTVALTTAGTSGPAETYTYSDYGAPQSGSWSAYQYAGYRYDSETGLYYVKARYYSPNLGRFLQSDPVGFRGGMNLYAYVGNDPVNLFDPTGLSALETQNDGGGDMSIPYEQTQNMPLTSSSVLSCAQGLQMSQKTMAAVDRANAAWNTIQAAADAYNIDPSLLAAIGVQETGFQNVWQSCTTDANCANADGAGIYQIDLGPKGGNPNVSVQQAFDPTYAANYAAQKLSNDTDTLAYKFPNFTPSQLTQATAASWNIGTSQISGNPNTIDGGTQPNGTYGATVLNLMTCF